ncbi:response regulator [Chitinophaga silvatica]|uniref:Response regulator n=1 Tax=Chitinophaga silvatica TaxID=2282649 RepID=A0A3E1Y5N6_9BACT|nr:cyclic nucleotide-binding domain-containing protein [Chitinophaga silvatica]RFS20060.1 response regulator [Chitinophaga silvatica]
MQQILLIGDIQDLQENIGELLEMNGYEVITAPNGREGISLAEAQQPDIILCEMNMKGIDGLGVLNLVRKNPDLEKVPFIFIAEKYNARLFRSAMNLGADDYLINPFSNNDLLLTVENRLRQYRREMVDMSNTSTVSGHRDMLRLVNEFIENRNTMVLAPQEIVYKEGGVPRFLYYVLKGKVKTIKTHEDGKDLVIGLYKKGDFFGYIALLEDTPYKATAMVMEETELALIPREDAEKILENAPYMLKRFVRMLAENVTEKEQRLLGIAYNTLRKKVASALIHLQNKYQQPGTQQFTIKISRDELAAVAGTATESLIRTLSEFKSEQLIKVSNGNITLLKPDKLEAIAFH